MKGTVGKFGWKGQFATLHDFVATACAVELGLANPYRSQDSPGDYAPDEEATHDMTRAQVRALVAFVRSLPRPEQVMPSEAAAVTKVQRGEQVFRDIGCAECHTPDMGGVEGVYSDFRLYDLTRKSAGYGVEQELADDLPLNAPEPEEWKTPPLWGVADSAPYFHDGRAATLEAAINAHHGQARRSRKKFEDAGRADREALLAFLHTLRAPQTDAPRALAQR